MYNESKSTTAGVIAAALAAFAIIGVIVFAMMTQRVSATESCIVTRFGKVHSTPNPGIHYHNGFTMEQICVSNSVKTYELVEGDPKDSDSRADYKDWGISTKTIDGVNVNYYAVIQYNIPRENMETIYNNFRGKDVDLDERVQEKVVKMHTRALIPQFLNTKTADQLYQGNLAAQSKELFDLLSPRFAENGVVLKYAELKRGSFDPAYEQKIQETAGIQQDTQRTIAQAELREAEAENQRIQAEGNAAAQRIAAQGEADAITIRAQADAEAEQTRLQARADALNANPSLIEYEAVQSLRDANVVYLPSDMLPIIDIMSGVREGVGPVEE